MPEVRELREALPEMSQAPITGIGMVASRGSAPQGYEVILNSDDNVEADLWKDKMFKSKTKRYLCVTRKGHGDNVVVDMKLVGEKETLPVGFMAVQDTLDTKEPALQKKRLCVKLIPRDSTEVAVCDVKVNGRARQPPPHYTFIGELNSMGLWFKLGRVPKSPFRMVRGPSAPQLPTPTPSPRPKMPPRQDSAPLPVLPSRFDARLDTSYQSQAIYTSAMSAMEGVPFVLHERYATDSNNYEIPHIQLKSFKEIESEYDYDFLTERSAAAARKPPAMS
ncbi:multivesicular body subunit 12B isoform X1 [Lampetra fluviatilis]